MRRNPEKLVLRPGNNMEVQLHSFAEVHERYILKMDDLFACIDVAVVCFDIEHQPYAEADAVIYFQYGGLDDLFGAGTGVLDTVFVEGNDKPASPQENQEKHSGKNHGEGIRFAVHNA